VILLNIRPRHPKPLEALTDKASNGTTEKSQKVPQVPLQKILKNTRGLAGPNGTPKGRFAKIGAQQYKDHDGHLRTPDGRDAEGSRSQA